MKIKVHEAEVNAGYCRPIFRGIRREDIVKEIAVTCRKDWKNHDWGMEEDGINERQEPPIPDSDDEVVSTFFYGDADEDVESPWIAWNDFKVDLAPPYDVDIDLTVDTSRFTIRRTNPRKTRTRICGVGAVLDGTLIEDGGFANDVLEGFLLALTAAGFPVHTKEFRKCLSDYCETAANHMADELTDEELEEMERDIAGRGISIMLDREHNSWRAFKSEGEIYIALKKQPKVGFTNRVEALEFAFNER